MGSFSQVNFRNWNYFCLTYGCIFHYAKWFIPMALKTMETDNEKQSVPLHPLEP